jgi:hypothetical protein
MKSSLKVMVESAHQIRDQVCWGLYDKVGSQVWEQVRDQVRKQVWDAKNEKQ